MAERNFVIQHQPLRVPSSFGPDGRAFVIQTNELMDDIYRRLTNIQQSLKDLDARVKALEDTENV
jgi:hypothetical protein